VRNPVLSGFVQKRRKSMSILTKGKVVDPVTGRDKVTETAVEIVGGMVLQPYNANNSKLTNIGDKSTVHWLGISGPDTAIKEGATLVDSAGNRYRVIASEFWVDYWESALLDLSITPAP
jgi:hypothetical protein